MDNVVLRKKRITVDLTLALIFLAVFLVMLLMNILYSRYVQFAPLALFLVPPGLFCFFRRYYRKHAVGRTKRIVIRSICIFGSIALLLFSFGKMVYNDFTAIVTNPIYYQHLLDSQDEWTEFFPRAVPADAKDAKIYDDSGFDFLLKYKTTPDEINTIVTEYEGKAQFVIDMGEFNSADYKRADGIFYPFFFEEITGYDTLSLPDDFKLFILKNDPTSCWNHGASSGIAVSTQRCEVIYWFERS